MYTAFLRSLLLAAELYHAITHWMVLSGMRLLPRKDLVRVRYYFLVDTCCVFLCTVFFARHLWFLCIPQIVQHVYYWATWDQSKPAVRIITWSSLDFDTLNIPRFGSESALLALGTAFDLGCHVIMAVILATQSSWLGVGVSLIITAALLKAVLFNPRFAWAERGGSVPLGRGRGRGAVFTFPVLDATPLGEGDGEAGSTFETSDCGGGGALKHST